MMGHQKVRLRLFSDYDRREGSPQNRGIDVIALPREANKSCGIVNQMLNALGFGCVVVELRPPPERIREKGAELFKVSIQSATHYINANVDFLFSIGALSSQDRAAKVFSPEAIARIIQGLYTISIAEKDKVQYVHLYWKLKHSPELMAYLKALGIAPPTSEKDDALFTFMTLSLFKELGYEKKPVGPEAFYELTSKIEKKFFSEVVVHLTPAAKAAIRRLRPGTIPQGELVAGGEMIRMFLSDLSKKINAHLASLPKSLRLQFDQTLLLGADDIELADFEKVIAYTTQKKQMDAKWQSAHPDTPLPKLKQRNDIVAFVKGLEKNNSNDSAGCNQ